MGWGLGLCECTVGVMSSNSVYIEFSKKRNSDFLCKKNEFFRAKKGEKWEKEGGGIDTNSYNHYSILSAALFEGNCFFDDWAKSRSEGSGIPGTR